MGRPTITLRGPISTWTVESSQMVRMPDKIEAVSVEALRHELQRIAATYRPRPGKPPLGILTFRYEHDRHDRIEVVHAYFRGSDQKLKRFARLRREAAQVI